mmetsp:Transcript_2539/g.6422  ORF Transcript_2539/g.6422 Transcript_2539/m.6422 type:complete len:264 (+) Transcript_2539:596-1387(+)
MSNRFSPATLLAAACSSSAVDAASAASSCSCLWPSSRKPASAVFCHCSMPALSSASSLLDVRSSSTAFSSRKRIAAMADSTASNSLSACSTSRSSRNSSSVKSALESGSSTVEPSPVAVAAACDFLLSTPGSGSEATPAALEPEVSRSMSCAFGSGGNGGASPPKRPGGGGSSCSREPSGLGIDGSHPFDWLPADCGRWLSFENALEEAACPAKLADMGRFRAPSKADLLPPVTVHSLKFVTSTVAAPRRLLPADGGRGGRAA